MIIVIKSSWVKLYLFHNNCGNNSVVECNLAKVEVVGSNPISRSRVDNCLGLCCYTNRGVNVFKANLHIGCLLL